MSSDFNPGGGPDLRDQFRQEFNSQQSQLDTQKRKRSIWVIGSLVGIALLVLLLGGSAVGSYNSLTTSRNQVTTAFSNVDAELQRRADLIPNLVATVKGYAGQEQTIFTEIAEARSRLLNAKTVGEKSEANDQLTGTLGRLLMLTENYPNLKSDQNFLRLQDELAGTENRIKVARRDYNSIVLNYNNGRDRFPGVIFANMFNFQRAEEFKAAEGAREAPKVQF